MDSEVTNLAQVKAFDTTDYATSTQGTTADNALPLAGGTMTGDVSLGDNVKAKFGAGDDLQIYHDGSHSYIKDNGTGDLLLQGTQLQLRANNGEKWFYGTENAGVNLYYNNASKFATTSTGIDVTGSVTCDGFTSTGIDDNATSTAITIASTGGVTIAPSTTPVALSLTPNNSNCDITFASTNTSSATRLRTSINDFQIHTNGVQKVSVGSGGDVTVNTGNLVIGTSGKGIDFSATSDGSGTMTSEVLDDYEEGTWTPTDLSGATLALTVANCFYTKVGRLVTIVGHVTYPTTTSTASAKVGGLPFTPIGSINPNLAYSSTTAVTGLSGGVDILFSLLRPGINTTNSEMSGAFLSFSISYNVA
jgi:hypothetical protein